MRRALCLALGFLFTPLAAEDFSRHCAPPPKDASLAQGRYEGSFEVGMTFIQNLGGGPIKQTIKGTGKFNISIKRVSGRDASSAEGELSTSTDMNWSAGGGTADQHLKGSGSLALKDAVRSQSFTLTSAHTTSGQITVSAMGHSASQGQSLSDQVELEFVADSADCNQAQGVLRSSSLDAMEESMKQAGYQVERLPWTWRMARVEDASDKFKALKDELKQKAGGDTREAEASRLAKIADRIKQEEPADLQECLFDIWMDHVRDQYATWLQEDASRLSSYNGDWGGLQQLMTKALASDRSLALLGMDTCLESIHQQFWNAMSGALSRYLERMAKGKAPMAHLLEVLRSAELLGAVSPELREQVWTAIQQEARQKADDTYKAFLEQVKQARARGVQNEALLQDPAVAEAHRLAILAEGAANMLGVDVHRAEQWS